MKKVVMLLLVVGIAACTSTSDLESAEERIAALESELLLVQDEVSALQTERVELLSKLSNLESQSDELQSEFTQVECPTPPALPGSDYVIVILSVKDFRAGEIIPLDGIIMAPFPMDYVVETYIADPDGEDLLPQVVGCKALVDIPRGMLLTTTMFDCP